MRCDILGFGPFDCLLRVVDDAHLRDLQLGGLAVAEGVDGGVPAVAECCFGFQPYVDVEDDDDLVPGGEELFRLAGAFGPGCACTSEVRFYVRATVTGGAARVLGGLDPCDVFGEWGDGGADVVAVYPVIDGAQGFDLGGEWLHETIMRLGDTVSDWEREFGYFDFA